MTDPTLPWPVFLGYFAAAVGTIVVILLLIVFCGRYFGGWGELARF